MLATGPQPAVAGGVAHRGIGTDTSADSQGIPGPMPDCRSVPGQRRPRDSGECSSSGAGREGETEAEAEGGKGPPPAKRRRVEPGADPVHRHANSLPVPMQVTRVTRDSSIGDAVVLESTLDASAGAKPVTSAPSAPVDGCAADSRPGSISSDADEDEVEEVSAGTHKSRLDDGKRRLVCLQRWEEAYRAGIAQVQSLPVDQAEAWTEQHCSRSWVPASSGCGGS